MEVRPEIALLVLGCALVTALPRVLPLVLLARLELAAPLRQWLGYVPVAVLAIIPALMIAALTESLLATVVIGVMAYAMLPFLV
jgi:branched chain amino acid efflux pump